MGVSLTLVAIITSQRTVILKENDQLAKKKSYQEGGENPASIPSIISTVNM